MPSLAKCHAEFQGRSGDSFLKANTEAPSIYVTDINPVPGPEPMAIVTADFLSVDDSTNAEGLEGLGIMNDNDDVYAFFAIRQIPEAQRPQWPKDPGRCPSGAMDIGRSTVIPWAGSAP